MYLESGHVGSKLASVAILMMGRLEMYECFCVGDVAEIHWVCLGCRFSDNIVFSQVEEGDGVFCLSFEIISSYDLLLSLSSGAFVSSVGGDISSVCFSVMTKTGLGEVGHYILYCVTVWGRAEI